MSTPLPTVLPPLRRPPRTSPLPTVPGPGRSSTIPQNSLQPKRGFSVRGEKVVIYGPACVGKSSLCASIIDVGFKPFFIDVGDSTSHMNVSRVQPANLAETRSALHDDSLLAPYGAVVLDDLTAGEEFGLTWVLRNIPHEKKLPIIGLEDYGWGKGYVHLFEASLLLLCDLDRIARMGKHVLVTAHDTIELVKNPMGEDYFQHQPRLRSNKNAKFRERVLEWCYHMIFIDFDVAISKDGKPTGAGTRTIYPSPMPYHWAKSRTLVEPIAYPKGDSTFWQQLLGKESNA